MTIGRVTKTIEAENIFSDWIRLQQDFNFSLSGSWTATVTLQRSFDKGTTPLDVEEFTENVERVGLDPEDGVLYRFGVKTGNFTSGSIVGRISQ